MKEEVKRGTSMEYRVWRSERGGEKRGTGFLVGVGNDRSAEGFAVGELRVFELRVRRTGYKNACHPPVQEGRKKLAVLASIV